MAQFSVSGLDELMLTMQEVAVIPEDVIDGILNDQADALVEHIKLRGEGYGVVDSGDMLKSIKKGKAKRGKKGGRQIVVSARGRKRGSKTTNAEIAFLNNYGTRHQKARPFWSDSEKLSEMTFKKIARDHIDHWLKSKDL